MGELLASSRLEQCEKDMQTLQAKRVGLGVGATLTTGGSKWASSAMDDSGIRSIERGVECDPTQAEVLAIVRYDSWHRAL